MYMVHRPTPNLMVLMKTEVGGKSVHVRGVGVVLVLAKRNCVLEQAIESS